MWLTDELTIRRRRRSATGLPSEVPLCELVKSDKMKHHSLRRVSVLLVLTDHSWADARRGSVYKHSTHRLAGTDTV